MVSRDEKLPTEAELEILATLWALGPSTVRQIHAAIAEGREVGYTTVLKLLQIMTGKGLVERDKEVRPQIYRPARSAQQTRRHLLDNLMDRAFGGSPGKLILQALSARPASDDELRMIREMLDKAEQGRGDEYD